MKRKRLCTTIVLGLTAALMSATTSADPILEIIAPPTTYVEGVDYDVMNFSGLGDVTAPVFAVDILLAPQPVAANTSTSGCEAADFAGFPAGDIALLQRGTCTFFVKAANAEAAGATGVIIFNEGSPGRTDRLAGTLGVPGILIPVVGTTFAVGQTLGGFTQNGSFLTGFVARLEVSADDLPQTNAVPEPATLALLGLGFAGIGFARRRT